MYKKQISIKKPESIYLIAFFVVSLVLGVESLVVHSIALAMGLLLGFFMKKKSDLVWSISLMVIGIATFILAGANIVEIDLPDFIVRIVGIVDLVALPILVYSTIKRVKKD